MKTLKTDLSIEAIQFRKCFRNIGRRTRGEDLGSARFVLAKVDPPLFFKGVGFRDDQMGIDSP